MTKSFPLKGPSLCRTDGNGVNICCTLSKYKSVSLHICICQQKITVQMKLKRPSDFCLWSAQPLPSHFKICPKSFSLLILTLPLYLHSQYFQSFHYFISFYTFFKWPKLASGHIGFMCVLQFKQKCLWALPSPPLPMLLPLCTNS